MDEQDSTPARHYRDYLDLCCEMLSDENAALRFELRETQADRDTHRELSHVTLAALSKVTRERDRLRDRIRKLLDELRRLRDCYREAA